jgi:glycosyltransferase involved in cell wall biosynthesis
VLKKTLLSLEKQTLSSDRFEVVVVDDGSSDGTYNFLQNYKGVLNLISIRHTCNLGRGAARNTGIRKAEGEIILFVDDDVIPSKNLLNIHLRYHKREECICIGNIVYDKASSLMRYLSTRGVHKKQLIDFTCFATANVSLKKSDLLEVGGFNETLRIGEDIELGYKLSRKKFLYAPDAQVYHSHTVDIEKVLGDAYTLGKYSIPLFIKKDPIFKKIFKVYLIEPVKPGEAFILSFKKMFTRICLFRIVYIMVRKYVFLFNRFFVPSIFFDYLIFHNRVRGYEESNASF